VIERLVSRQNRDDNLGTPIIGGTRIDHLSLRVRIPTFRQTYQSVMQMAKLPRLGRGCS
jgi:hypothetical protein